MRRYMLRAGVALLTFLVGSASVRIHGHLHTATPTPEDRLVSPPTPVAAGPEGGNPVDPAGPRSPHAAGRLTKGLRVTFLRLKPSQEGIGIVYRFAEFRVDNEGSQAAHYPGYGKNSHCGESVRHGGRVKRASGCWCGTGLGEQTLLPGESATFDVGMPEGQGPFEAGFSFLLGKRRSGVTAWSWEVARPSA